MSLYRKEAALVGSQDLNTTLLIVLIVCVLLLLLAGLIFVYMSSGKNQPALGRG